MLSKNTFSTEQFQATASEFLQKDTDKSKECQTNETYQKESYTEKKSKAWNRGKQTHIPVTLTESLVATDKG